MPIVNLRYYKNLTKKGNPSVSKVRRGVYYYGYGIKEENPEFLPRGQWYGPDGWERHGDVVNWATGNARVHKFTYTILLSVRDGQMLDSDFVSAMKQGCVFEDWRLIMHDDTDHYHAHVVAFRDEKLARAQFDMWRERVGMHLGQAEELRLREAVEETIPKPQQVEQLQSAAPDLEWEL